MPTVPGFVSETVVPMKSSGEIVPLRERATRSSKAFRNSAKLELLGVLDVRDEERARAVLLLDVDRDAEAHLVALDAVRLAVHLGVGVVQARERVERAEDRPRDEVGEAHLALPRRLAVLVEEAPVLLERAHRDRADRRSRSGPGGSPPCSRRPASRRRGSAGARRRAGWRRAPPPSSARPPPRPARPAGRASAAPGVLAAAGAGGCAGLTIDRDRLPLRLRRQARGPRRSTSARWRRRSRRSCRYCSSRSRAKT